MGMAVGTIFAVGIMVANKLGVDIPAKPWGVHAGVWGLLINMAIIFMMEKCVQFDIWNEKWYGRGSYANNPNL